MTYSRTVKGSATVAAGGVGSAADAWSKKRTMCGFGRAAATGGGAPRASRWKRRSASGVHGVGAQHLDDDDEPRRARPSSP